jgi:hypothetical protein
LDIINIARRPNDDSQISANIKLQVLLTDLYIKKRWDHQATSLPFEKINFLLAEINNNVSKWWTVEEMAEKYESELKKAKTEALIEQESEIKKISSNLSEEFLKEKQKYDSLLKDFTSKLESEKIQLKKELDKESKEISELIVKKIVG